MGKFSALQYIATCNPIFPPTHTTGASYPSLPAPTLPAAPARILPVGDSITIGNNDPALGGFRSRIQSKAFTDGKSITWVGSQSDGPATVDGQAWSKNHEGRSGYRITDYIPDGLAATLTAYPCDIMMFMLGTNDIFNVNDACTAATNWNTVVTGAFTAQPSLTVVACQIPKMPHSQNYRSAGVIHFNNTIIDHAITHRNAGRKLYLIDIYEAITAAQMADGIHPNEAGFDGFATEVWTTLKTLVPSS